MSNTVWPVLPGLTWDVKKTPEFNTMVQTSVSGKEARASFWTAPRWHFELAYELLRPAAKQELEAIMGLFLQMNGSAGSFYYTDPNDNAVAGQAIGTGTGSQTAYQLVRTISSSLFSIAGFTEPMLNIKAIAHIYLAGIATSAYTLAANPSGIINFTAPPGNGVAITGDFSYYFRCRFKEDSQEFNQFMHNLYEAKQIELFSLKGE